MAQRFSVVNINDGEHEIFMRGYVGLDELRKSRLVLGIMSEVPSSKLVPFQIQHCLQSRQTLSFPWQSMQQLLYVQF